MLINISPKVIQSFSLSMTYYIFGRNKMGEFPPLLWFIIKCFSDFLPTRNFILSYFARFVWCFLILVSIRLALNQYRKKILPFSFFLNWENYLLSPTLLFRCLSKIILLTFLQQNIGLANKFVRFLEYYYFIYY